MTVCHPLVSLRAEGIRGSWAEHPTQLLGRGDGQGAGEIAADIRSGFAILPLQGCKERQLAVEEPSAVSICQQQHLQKRSCQSAASARQLLLPCPQTHRALAVPPHALNQRREGTRSQGDPCQPSTMVPGWPTPHHTCATGSLWSTASPAALPPFPLQTSSS